MAKGTIEGTTSSTYCISKIEWSATANKDTNKSTVTATLYLKRTNDYSTTGQEWAFEISIDGKKTSVSNIPLTVRNEWVKAMEATTTVDHNGDGTKSVTISASGGNPDTSVKSISCSDTVTLDTIARASSITSASDVTLGEKCNVKWTPSSATFWYKLYFFVENEDKVYTTDAIHPNTTESYTYTGFTIPLDAAEVFTQSRTGTMKVILTTYSDSNATKQVGSQSETSITVTVPSSTLPTVSFDSVAPVHSLPEDFNGLYVQGYSKVKVMLNAETQYNAGIDYFDFTVEGNTYGLHEDYTSAHLASSGLISIVGHAVDTRGYGGYVQKDINVIPYTRPKVQNVTVQRCDAKGNTDDSGTYLKISAKRVYSKMEVDEVQKNRCSIQYRYRSENGSYPEEFVTILERTDASTDEITTDALLEGALSVDNTYHVQVRVKDDIGNDSYTTVTIPTEKVYWHRDGARNALGLGKYNEKDNAIDSDWDFYMNDHKVTGLPLPTNDSDAVPKSYVDKADVKISKSLDKMGWYKIGTVSGEMCAVATFTIGGEYGNDDPSPSMIDIATQYNHSRAFLRLPAVSDSQVSKLGLIQESASVCGVYLYYNSTMANTVKVNIHTHMGNFSSGGLSSSDVSDSTMIAAITLIE